MKKYPREVVCRADVAVLVPQITKVPGAVVTETACQPTVFKTKLETATTTLCAKVVKSTTTKTTSVTCTTNLKTTVTSTAVRTSTQTNYPPEATYYAQCGPSNQVSRDSKGGRLALYSEAADHNPTLDAVSAYECCVACLLSNKQGSFCAGSNFIEKLTGEGMACQLNLYDTCRNSAKQELLAMNYYSSDIGVDVIVSNGQMGRHQYVDSSGKACN